MRDLWLVAWQDLRILLRDKETLLWVFLMPPLFIGFFGMATAGFGPASINLDAKTALELRAAADDDPIESALREALDAAGYDLAASNARRRLELPERLGERLLAGESFELELQHPGGSSLELDRYRVGRALGSVLAQLVVLDDARRVPDEAGFAWLRAEPAALRLAPASVGASRVIPRGFQQTVPANLVMFTLIVLLTSGGVLLLHERRQGLLVRLAAAPMGRGRLVAGKWLGKLLLAAVQIVFLLLVGRFGFGVGLGPSPLAVLLVLLAWAGFCASCSMALGLLARSEGQAVGLGVAGSLILAALGGCWWPLEIAPPAMQQIGRALPTGWAIEALHKLMTFGAAPIEVWPQFSAMLLAALLIALWVARRFRFAPDV